jgi:hypothetical protein
LAGLGGGLAMRRCYESPRRPKSRAGRDGLGGAILEGADPGLLGAMGAAEHPAVAGLETMADNAAVAVIAMRRHGRDRAFETVEGHGGAALGDLEGFVVVIAAEIAFGHGTSSLSARPAR